MKNIIEKTTKLFRFLRITAYGILGAILLFATVKGVAGHHVPDVALQLKIDMARESTEKKKNQEATKKVEKYKEDKKNNPKPTSQDKKNSTKDKARNLH